MNEFITTITHIIITVLLTITSICDIKDRSIPVILPALIGASGIVYAVICDPSALIRMAIVGVLFFLVAFFSHQAIGYGDVAVVAGLSLVSGAFSLILMISTALLLCSIWSIVKRMKSDEDSEVAFIPFISAGYLLALL